MTAADHITRQRAFYDSRAHDHLQARHDDPYARKLACTLATAVGLEGHHQVLELGAGFGRFTFPLLELCGSLVALDVSQHALDTLAHTRDERGIPEARCRTLCCEALEFSARPIGAHFDFVVGFFFLHHLPAIAGALRGLAGVLWPGGRMAFLEPNRRNPLFFAQVLLCRDMTWQEEKGMFLLSQRQVEEAFRVAGLRPRATSTFGFFPPQIFNRLAGARHLEQRIDGIRLLRWLRPFLLLSAETPGGPEVA